MCGSKYIAEAYYDSFLPSWGVDFDDSFNNTNYQNGAAIRPIDRVCIGQIHSVIRISNKGCEWDLKGIVGVRVDEEYVTDSPELRIGR